MYDQCPCAAGPPSRYQSPQAGISSTNTTLGVIVTFFILHDQIMTMAGDSTDTEEMGYPQCIIEGEDLEAFEEYDKRPLTEKELQTLREAREVYEYYCSKNEASKDIL